MNENEVWETILKLKKYIYKICANKHNSYFSNRIDIDDLFQACIFRLQKHLKKYDPLKSSLKTFVVMHTQFEIIDIYRGIVGRSYAVKNGDPCMKYKPKECSINSPHQFRSINQKMYTKSYEQILGYTQRDMQDEYIDFKHKDKIIRNELQDCDPRFIKIYDMYNNGYTLKEIGEMLEVTESRVSQMLLKIKRIIISLFQEGGNFDRTKTKAYNKRDQKTAC